MSGLEECDNANAPLLKDREDLTLKIELLQESIDASRSKTYIKDKIADIKTVLKAVERLDKSILANIDKFPSLRSFYQSEFKVRYRYKAGIEEKMCVLVEKMDGTGSIPSVASSVSISENNSIPENNGENVTLNPPDRPQLSNLNFLRGMKEPPMHLEKFEGNEKDRLAFSRFFAKFKAIVDENPVFSDQEKLLHLLGNLGGSAFEMVKHLSMEAGNYSIALEILKSEFLDVEYLVDSIFVRLHEMPPPPENNLPALKTYLHEVKGLTFDLKSYGSDLLTRDASGAKLLSSIIVHKLPISFKHALFDKVSSNYPYLVDLFEHSNEIVKRLQALQVPLPKHEGRDYGLGKVGRPSDRGRPPNQNKNTNNRPYKFASAGGYPYYSEEKFARNPQPKGTLENFKTSQNFSNKSHNRYKNNSRPSLPCKFCASVGHSMNKCSAYPDIESRLIRCDELNICRSCSSTKHASQDCPGLHENFLDHACNYCGLYTHISPLCKKGHEKQKPNLQLSTNLCLNFNNGDRRRLLPFIEINLHQKNRQFKVLALLDTGSERSYVSSEAAAHLVDLDSLHTIKYDIHSFVGYTEKEFKLSIFEIDLPDRLQFPFPLLIDETFSIKFENKGLKQVHNNLTKLGYSCSNSLGILQETETVEIHALIGIDLIEFLPSWDKEKCMKGSCFRIGKNIVPFGDVQNFLYPEQIEKYNLFKGGSAQPALCEYSAQSSLVNQVLNPCPSYFNPLLSILEESSVEQGLDNLFTLESLGITNVDEDMARADVLQVCEFDKHITFKDNKYHVKLPWKENVDLVPSNHVVARKVLDRVVINLRIKGIFKEYDAVFQQQLADGIIERVELHPSEFDKCVFIPHRPVIKDEAQVTTKIRPIFNCSLKTRTDLPSLNETAYPGVNLLNSLLKLLLQFRCNKFVVLADIKQAFLNIKLLTVEDRNRFCFFWIENGKIVVYRYSTLVFGFVSSPFILHYVMLYHASKFPNDLCSRLLANNFYVDNFIYTSNDPVELEGVYKEACVRMDEASFNLRSWNTNLPNLQNIFEADRRLVQHGLREEKVLGLRYLVDEDSLGVAKIQLDCKAYTKRQILAAISSFFDPLGYFLPLLVTARILMRNIWTIRPKVAWDDRLPIEITEAWQKVAYSLNLACELTFNRCVLVEGESYGLHIFCDSSKTSYGFVMYSCRFDGKTDLIFAKAKMAPLKELSIPCLELMAVVLTFKCLPSILAAFERIEFQFINIVVDAQVVLSWLLTNSPKCKSKIVVNRLKDIELAKREIFTEFKLPILFRYTDTNNNPADLLTKGVSFKKFCDIRDFWEKGPSFLSNDFEKWPKHELLSIPSECKAKNFVHCNVISRPAVEANAVLNIEKFSDLDKLIRITALLFKFRYHKIEGADSSKAALLYWIKNMQSVCFEKEIRFLKAEVNPEYVPALVKNLDLFLDDNVLRSHGRISKSLYFNFDICNPILLDKGHRFTYLFIMSAHSQVQHLGIQTTLNCIRNKGFWIPQARQAIKTALSTCFLCRKYNALCYNYPKLTNLPKHQVDLIKPFNQVGVDYTSHIWVKDAGNDGTYKMYILLFTCMNIRAIHLELVPDMSTENFLMAFQRFCNMYVIPSHLYSDNARSFVKAGDILEDVLCSQEFCDHLIKLHIKHVRIPVYSPAVAGAWERQVRTVKTCLYKVVGTKKLTYFELLTTLSSIQNAINSRPLTYRSSENDLEIISPNSFLKMHCNSALVLREAEEDPWREIDRETVLESLDQQLITFEEFRRLWYELYLLSLREHSRNLYQTAWTNRIKSGDVVLIKHPDKPRPFWMLGRVLEIILGHDNIIRSVRLKQSNGQIAHHSISNLYPMELSITHSSVSQDEERVVVDDAPSEEVANLVPAPAYKRPKRKAAVKFRKFLKENLDDL